MQRGGAAECEARPSRRASSAALQGPASLRNVKLPLRRAVHAELRASQAGRGTAGRAPAASRTRQCSCPRPSRRPSRRDRSRRRRRRRSARPTLPRLARHRLARGPHRSAAPQRRAAAPIRSAATPRRRASRVASRPPLPLRCAVALLPRRHEHAIRLAPERCRCRPAGFQRKPAGLWCMPAGVWLALAGIWRALAGIWRTVAAISHAPVAIWSWLAGVWS